MNPENKKETIHLGDLLKAEHAFMKKRRADRGTSVDPEADALGIALSGGGIRSATVNLGIMEELNKIGLLEKADYLSSVSGGGYLASYIHHSLNGDQKVSYEQLFDDDAIRHLRSYGSYLMVWPRKGIGEWISWLVLLLVAAFAIVLNLLWLALPVLYWYLVKNGFIQPEFTWGQNLLVMVLLGGLAALFLSPNFTSPHWFYKARLSRAFLWRNKRIKIKDLTSSFAPFPLINTAVHVNYDDYDQDESITYRGQIDTNYFVFSPLYCGSQVTRYVSTENIYYRKLTLATAMSTSAAAVNTFMGNMNLPGLYRMVLVLLNLRTGILAPNPQLQSWWPTFWPWYTFLELMGNPTTTSYRIQLSDGGHIENLAVYELIRRKVRTIIAIDAGEDPNFEFFDLRNLVIRARNELGAVIEFPEGAAPQDIIRPDPATGLSKSHFAVAKITGLKGAYSEKLKNLPLNSQGKAPRYEGYLVYIKSTILSDPVYRLRNLKNRARRLEKEKRALALQKTEFRHKAIELEGAKKDLNRYMYRTYTPDFPHQSTSDQFFDEVQWDAYRDLGKNIGARLIADLDFNKKDLLTEVFLKCRKRFEES